MLRTITEGRGELRQLPLLRKGHPASPPLLFLPLPLHRCFSFTSHPCFSLTSFSKAAARNPLLAFLHVSYTFLFSSCFESEICHSQHRATLCPSKHLLKLSSAIKPRKTWEEAPRVLLHSPTYNNSQCRCTVSPSSLTSW